MITVKRQKGMRFERMEVEEVKYFGAACPACNGDKVIVNGNFGSIEQDGCTHSTVRFIRGGNEEHIRFPNEQIELVETHVQNFDRIEQFRDNPEQWTPE